MLSAEASNKNTNAKHKSNEGGDNNKIMKYVSVMQILGELLQVTSLLLMDPGGDEWSVSLTDYICIPK